MKKFIIDIPSYTEGEYLEHLIQEKTFEFLNDRGMGYIVDYEILIRYHDSGNENLEELIEDWKLKYSFFKSKKENPSNMDKVKLIKDMVREADYALVFFDHSQRDKDMGNKILLDQCLNNGKLRTGVIRCDFGFTLY